MSADQLIAELKALPHAERQQVITAVLSDEMNRLTDVRATVENLDFVDRWKGVFSLPESVPGDARLCYLLDRFSS